MNGPFSKLPITIKAQNLQPHFFSENDLFWLHLLINEFTRFEGKSLNQWKKNVEAGFRFKMPFVKGHFALCAIEKNLTSKKDGPSDLFISKKDLFINASKERKGDLESALNIQLQRDKLISNILLQYPQISQTQIEESLLSGTNHSSFLLPTNHLGKITDLPQLLNSHLIKKIMMRSLQVEIILSDQSRRIVRQAKLRGLICEVLKLKSPYFKLRISGPMALFGPTTLYGRRFQEFIPLLFWNMNFKLRSTFQFHHQTFYLHLDTSSPLKISSPPKLFDSKWEEAFYQSFQKNTQNWDLLREAEPIQVGSQCQWIFLDFKIVPRKSQIFCSEDIWVEIIGFWTEDYFRKKLSDIELLAKFKVIFIISEKWKGSFNSHIVKRSPSHHFIFFKRKIPLDEVMVSLFELNKLRENS